VRAAHRCVLQKSFTNGSFITNIFISSPLISDLNSIIGRMTIHDDYPLFFVGMMIETLLFTIYALSIFCLWNLLKAHTNLREVLVLCKNVSNTQLRHADHGMPFSIAFTDSFASSIRNRLKSSVNISSRT